MKLKQTIAGVVSTALTAAMFVAPVVASVQIEDKKITSESAHCLALNVYYEARGSNLADQASVADVVLNRVQDTRYPSTICGVVYQGKKNANGTMKRNACQFSWYCDGRSDLVHEDKAWAKSIDLAFDVLMGVTADNTHGATHYYNPSKADPHWAQQYAMTAQHGNHVFMTMVY